MRGMLDDVVELVLCANALFCNASNAACVSESFSWSRLVKTGRTSWNVSESELFFNWVLEQNFV